MSLFGSPKRLAIVFAVCILAYACAPEPLSPPLSPTIPGETVLPTAPSATPSQEAETATPSPGAQLASSDQVILTITNPEPFSSREGDPRPDWLAWGAETFSLAPDGSIWIADTAPRPQRLLHFSRQGELLQEIPLGDITGGVYDILATDSAVWMLDLPRAQVVRLGLDGRVELAVSLPQEMFMMDGTPVANALSSLRLSEDGALLISGLSGLYELVNPSGEVTLRRLEDFSYQDHSYRVLPDPAEHTLSIIVDGEPLPIAPPFYAEVEPFVGFAANGDVSIAAFREIPVPDGVQIDWLILYYSPNGGLSGVARRWPRTFSPEFAHDLAFGPDGQVYQLVSHPDRTVQVIRLGFHPNLETLPDPPPQPTPLPIPTPLTALQLPWEISPQDATDLEIARHALVSFFANLNDRQYAKASEYFGGPIDYIVELGVPAGGGAEFWQHTCTIMLCMPLSAIYSEEQVAEDEFVFYVGFIFMDGSRFEDSGCCGGDQAAAPPVWQFAYPVKKLAGQWKVMRGPLYVP